MKTGSELIAEERTRQMYDEGYDANHDSWHLRSELAIFADCYVLDTAAKNKEVDIVTQAQYSQIAVGLMPFDREYWKPESDPVRQLVKAGALIAAEIDWLQSQG